MEEDSSGSNNRDDQTNASILSYLSFAVPNESHRDFFQPMSARRRHHQGAPSTMQGVLWKRRDVFRNRWRPRWFVLHPQQGILTYYLLTSSTPASPTAVSTGELGSNRRRADSDISMDTIDYDVVPRGSIFLGNPSCTVGANESLTRVEERLYALTISDRETGTHCHLACRSSTARDRWLEKIQEAIVEHQSLTSSQRSGEQEVTEPRRDDGGLPELPTLPVDLPRSEQTSIQKESSPSLSSEKWTTVPSSNLTKGVPLSIVAKIDTLLEANLPYAMDPNHPDFKVLNETEGVKLTKHKSLPLLRSIYSTKHHPTDYLGLLWDFPLAAEIEPNLRIQECTRTLNEHTSFVYSVYQPVWPSAPRDFSSVAHWRLLQNSNNDVALCLVAFSCPEANKLKPPQANHVRGTLNVSMHIWKPTPGGGCTHIRIVSFDLNGAMPKPLVQTIHQQQATLPPRAMDLYLQGIKSTKKDTQDMTNRYQMDYVSMYRAIDRVKSRSQQSLRHNDSMVVCPANPTEQFSFKGTNDVNVLMESIVLLIPLVLQRLLVSVSPRLEMVACLTAMVLSVRWVLVQHLLGFFRLQPLQKGLTSPGSIEERTICRVGLDIKTLLAFLENEKQARTALGEDGLAALDVNHVLLRAIAKAMHRCPVLLVRSFPLLPPLYNMDVEWHDPQHRLPIWIPSSELWSIQTIADFCATNQGFANPVIWSLPRMLGPVCRFFTSSCNSSFQSNRTIVSASPMTHDCPISILVYPYGSLPLNTTKPIDISSVQDNEYPGSRLELIITLQTTEVAVCQQFVEEIERSILYPELCDV